MSLRQPETPSSGLGSMLTQDYFQVPNHQRDYSWTKDEINQLFNDLNDAIKASESQYFLGLMVCMPSENNTLIVLDGQQRLATTVIFLSAVRAWLKQVEKHREDAQQIRDDYIGRRKLGEECITAKLNLNSANNLLFHKLVVNDAPILDVKKILGKTKRHDRNYRLLSAIIECHDRVEAIANESLDAEEAAQRLIELVKYITDNVRIVRFVVEDDSSAYTIFETLNDRGLDLATIDLVKNHIFGKLSSSAQASKIKELEERWAQMMFTLANYKADNFLKAFWTSRFGRTQRESLFKNLKKEYRTSQAVQELSVTMLSTAEQYVALENPDDPIWSGCSGKAKESISALKTLSGSQVHPIILAALEKFQRREIERLLWLLECIIVRYQLISGERTGRLEIVCASTAKAIFSGEIKSASDTKSALREIYMSDDEFQQNFQYKEERSPAKTMYILRKMEIEERRQKLETDYRELDPGTGLTVEHILPKNPGPDWSTTLSTDHTLHEECLYRIGNLCLLGKSNREIGSRGFLYKKEAYKRSDLVITNSLANYGDNWGRKEIDHRQAHMAKMAKAVWHFQ